MAFDVHAASELAVKHVVCIKRSPKFFVTPGNLLIQSSFFVSASFYVDYPGLIVGTMLITGAILVAGATMIVGAMLIGTCRNYVDVVSTLITWSYIFCKGCSVVRGLYRILSLGGGGTPKFGVDVEGML